MKKIVYYIITGIFIILPFSVKAISVYPSDITITPTPQTTTDFISAQINGSFATPGFTLNNFTLTNSPGNNFEIDFSISSPDGIILQVLDPFSYTVDLGILDAGDYSIMANFYIDGILDNSINNNFTVSAVPLPAAAWLFLSGIFSMLLIRKTSKKA